MDWKQIKTGENASLEKPSISSGRLEKAERMAIFAQRLFSFYHEQELAANPEIFLAGVVELFCNYPSEVVERAISPAFGLPAKFKFPPRLAEIKEFLDELNPKQSQRSYPILPRDSPLPKFERKPQHVSYGEFPSRPIGVFEKLGDKWNRLTK